MSQEEMPKYNPFISVVKGQGQKDKSYPQKQKITKKQGSTVK